MGSLPESLPLTLQGNFFQADVRHMLIHRHHKSVLTHFLWLHCMQEVG